MLRIARLTTHFDACSDRLHFKEMLDLQGEQFNLFS